MKVLEVSEATFESEVLNSELPVLIDLYADWCAPCKQLSPIVEEVGRELDGQLKVVKVNIDKNPTLAQTFRAQSIPMLVLIQDGQIANVQQGLVDKATLLKFVAPVLPKPAGEVKPAELAQLLLAKRVVPVDIRDASAFGRYRIPGAINVPGEQVESVATTFMPTDGKLRVLYGRSTDEAKTLADSLRKKGVSVGYLAGGFLHWEAEGLEVERGGMPASLA